MKILSWNVRGLGRPSKRHLVKDFILSSRVDIICLQESKLQDLHRSIWRSIGGPRLDTFEFLPASRTAGGIIIAWGRSQVCGTLIHKGTFTITIEFTNRDNNSIWVCTNVYGPNDRNTRSYLWNEVKTIKNLHFVPWVICGDFNTIFSPEDKNKGDLNPRDIATSQNILVEFNLIDPPLHGRGFTWTNGQTDPIWVRLDRFLLSHNWTSLHPRTLQIALTRFGSDHTPVCLEFGRLEKHWYSNELLVNLIQGWWSEINPQGCGAYILSKKLAFLKNKLRSWAKEYVGTPNTQTKSLLAELDSLDSINENRPYY